MIAITQLKHESYKRRHYQHTSYNCQLVGSITMQGLTEGGGESQGSGPPFLTRPSFLMLYIFEWIPFILQNFDSGPPPPPSNFFLDLPCNGPSIRVLGLSLSSWLHQIEVGHPSEPHQEFLFSIKPRKQCYQRQKYS